MSRRNVNSPYSPGSSVKERIFKIACELFHSQGYNSTGINEIIEFAEVARASFYQYYPSKKHLLLEYLRYSHEQVMREWRVGMQSCHSAKEKILELFECRIRRQIRTDFQGCVFAKISAELSFSGQDDTTVLTREHRLAIKKIISDLLQEIEEFSSAELKEKTELIFLLYEGAGLESSIQQNTNSLKSAMKIVARAI